MSLAAEDPIEKAIDRLADRFPGLARDHIETVVREEQARMDGSKVRDFIPVLVEREAMQRLRTEADPVPISPDGEAAVLAVAGDLDPMEIDRRREPVDGPLIGNFGADQD